MSVPSIRSTIAATLGQRRTECFDRFPKRRTLLTRWIKTKRRGSLGHRGPSLRRREIAQRGIELTHASHANEPIPIHNSLPNPEVRTRDRTRPLSWRQFLREYERGYYQEHSEQRCFNWSTHGAAPRYFGVVGSAHDPHGCAFACAPCTADLNRDGQIGGPDLSAILGARGSPEEPPPADALLEMCLAGLGFSSVEEFNAAIAVRNEAERIDLLNSLFMLLISAY